MKEIRITIKCLLKINIRLVGCHCQVCQHLSGQIELTGTSARFRSAEIMLPRGLSAYLLSSLASAMCACWPASDTAFTKALPLTGVAALPERMLRKFMCLP